MSESETYDTRVQVIRAYNRPLLVDFGTWLDHKGFSEQTVMNHLGNIYLFASYLVYSEPLKKLDEATESDVYWFLADWFPRKALWASVCSLERWHPLMGTNVCHRLHRTIASLGALKTTRCCIFPALSEV